MPSPFPGMDPYLERSSLWEEPTLALGELLAQIYDQVRYDLRIDYTSEPEPPLDPTVAAWSHDLLCRAGVR